MLVAVEPLVAGVRALHAIYVALLWTAPALLWAGLLAGRRASWLARLHLACLTFATLQLACGWPCPLTRLEEALAGRGPGSFVLPERWSSAAAVPPWAWLGLAGMWALSLWTARALRHGRAAEVSA